MKKEFFKVADDICIAATAEKAAELMNCSVDEVVFALTINNQKIGFCWVQLGTDKKPLNYQPSFENNIFEEDCKISKLKLIPINKDTYFVKDGNFCYYDQQEKVIYKVEVISSGRVATERALLAGIAAQTVSLANIKKKGVVGKPSPLYVWVVRDTLGRSSLFPVFDEDAKRLLDDKGNPLPNNIFEVRFLDYGQSVRKHGELDLVMLDPVKGYYLY